MEKEKLGEFNRSGTENNFDLKLEHNEITYTNGLNFNSVIAEKNDSTLVLENAAGKKKKNQKALIRLLSSFVFLLATVATVQTSVYIPIFSDIFSPTQVIETVESQNFAFSGISASASKISFTLSIENFSEGEEQYIYIVPSGDATDAFIGSVDESVRAIGRKKALSSLDLYSFTQYLTETGWVDLASETDYSIIVVRENSIIAKENVKTKWNLYISTIDVEVGTENIQIKNFDMVSGFENYSVVLIRLENVTDPMWGPEGDGFDHTTTNKENIESGLAGIPTFNVTKELYEQHFTLRIYISTDLPEGIEYSAVYNHNGEDFYLIYTKSDIIL